MGGLLWFGTCDYEFMMILTKINKVQKQRVHASLNSAFLIYEVVSTTAIRAINLNVMYLHIEKLN